MDNICSVIFIFWGSVSVNMWSLHFSISFSPELFELCDT